MSNNKRPLDSPTMKKMKVKTSELLNVDKAKCNGILRLFIGYVQKLNHELIECSVQECATFLNWLSSENIDVHQENWDSVEAEKLKQPHHLSYKKLPSFWASSLSDMLPILLKCNGNVNYVDENGKTILHVFLESHVHSYQLARKDCARKIIQMVQYLMGKGISVEAADRNGNTPLHLAAKLKSTDLMEMMLDNCMNLNIPNEDGDSVLHLVADNCVESEGVPIKTYARMVELMLSKGADVNLQNKEGWMPLHYAAKHNHFYMIKLLVKKKANLKLLANNGENPLLLSCKHIGSMDDAGPPIQSAELLLKRGCNVNVTDAEGYSSLHYVWLHYHAETAESLIEAGADIHCRTKDYLLTPLHTAVSHGDFRITKLLIDAGADVNAEAADSVTPLLLATLETPDHDRLPEYLIEKGAEIHCRETLFGFTMVHMAALCLYSDTKRHQFVLDQGLDVNDGGEYGITALHLASFLGKVDIVKVLIEHGADVHCRDSITQSTPLHFASKGGEILDFVISITGVERKPFWTIISPIKEDTEGVITMLVKNRADIHARDTSGRTALHLSTLYTKKEVIEDEIFAMLDAQENANIDPIRGLLKCGAHIDVQDNEGNLPLHNALKTGHEKGLKTLLDFNVDVSEDDTCSIVLSCKEDMKNQVLKDLVKLRAAGLPVSYNYIPHIDRLELTSYSDQCLKEVQKMKTHLIYNGISLYDLLHMNWKRRVNFVEKVPADLDHKYPMYHGIIQSSCREASQRKLLLEPATKAWHQLTTSALPDDCVEHILDYLKNRYLRVLVDHVLKDDI